MSLKEAWIQDRQPTDWPEPRMLPTELDRTQPKKDNFQQAMARMMLVLLMSILTPENPQDPNI